MPRRMGRGMSGNHADERRAFRTMNTPQLMVGMVALSMLLASAAHADCCDMGTFTRAGPAFEIAAKRQFGRGVSRRVSIQHTKGAEGREVVLAAMIVKDARYLGVEKGKPYWTCSFRTKPVIRFDNCHAWEGD